MPVSSDFVLASCQATLFTPQAELSTAQLLSRLLPQWSEQFDGEPFSLPAPPEGLPRHVPRVILQSKSEAWRCEISPARINLLWRLPTQDPLEPQGIELQDFYCQATAHLLEYADVVGFPVERLAAVVSRYVALATPASFLTSHFCHDRWLTAPFNRPESFELHAHKTFLLAATFQVNSWVRNKTGTLHVSEQPVVIVEQDLNTLAEASGTRHFTKEQISAFFEAAPASLDEVLALYYPG